MGLMRPRLLRWFRQGAITLEPLTRPLVSMNGISPDAVDDGMTGGNQAAGTAAPVMRALPALKLNTVRGLLSAQSSANTIHRHQRSRQWF